MGAIEWHGVALGRPGLERHSHSLAFTAGTPRWPFVLHAMFNAYWEPLTFELPRGGATPHGWQRCVDTALSSPDDFCTWTRRRRLRTAPIASSRVPAPCSPPGCRPQRHHGAGGVTDEPTSSAGARIRADRRVDVVGLRTPTTTFSLTPPNRRSASASAPAAIAARRPPARSTRRTCWRSRRRSATTGKARASTARCILAGTRTRYQSRRS